MGKQGIVKEGVLITCAMLIVSAAVYFFLVPSKIVVGSISGLAMVLAELLHMQMSTITFYLKCCTADGRFSLYREGIWGKDDLHVTSTPGIFVDF